MFELASRREFDLVLFWALERFSREGSAADAPSPATPRWLRRGVALFHRTVPRLHGDLQRCGDLHHGDHRQAGEHTAVRARQGRAGEGEARRRSVRTATRRGSES